MQITEQDHQRLIDFYKESLRRNRSNNSKAVHWSGPRDQLSRFNALCRISDLSGQGVLDVGCGLGDLYDFLDKNFKGFNYLGIDIVPDMIENAQKNYPQAKFELADIYNFLPGECDYVLASGSLTFNVSQGKAFYYQMIAQMYRVAKKGVAFNMLDQKYYDPDQDFLLYSPEEVMPVLENITKNYKIIFGYVPGDFTVHLLK